jgi:UDP-N-acetylglucosamine 1-carboxyvinyltransferase
MMFAEERTSTFEIQRSRLEGTVRLSGAKNSVLRLLAASLLTSRPVVLSNYPSGVLDARVHVGMLESLGKQCLVDGACITITEARHPVSVLKWPHRSIRNTLLILGALTARTGAGRVPLPGGCNIGAQGDRKFDLHVLVLESLGAKVRVIDDALAAEAPKGGLVGNDIHLPLRSTGATENAIICGSLASGLTRLWNPHIRPEIIDLVRFLRSMGARIDVFGQERIDIHGVAELDGTRHHVIADNMEALTWVIGSMITDGEVEIEDFPFDDLEVPMIFLRESGGRFYRCDRSLLVRGGHCFPIEISTAPYPGVNSDAQPLMAVLGAMANGESRLMDLRFPGRYAYADELARMGMAYVIDGNLLRIKGGRKLTGATVSAHDLRTGVALALAALTASGVTRIEQAWQIERGYDGFIDKLRALGGRIEPLGIQPPQTGEAVVTGE